MINEEHFKIKRNGELGAKGFCRNPKAIENYAFAISDDKRMWECHHRLETQFRDGTERPRKAQLGKEELIALGMYWDRPPEELIFLTKSEHRSLHNRWCKKKHQSEETKEKISKSCIGKCGGDTVSGRKWFTNGFINIRAYNCPPGFRAGRVGMPKGRKHSEETRKKMAASLKGRKSTFLGKHHTEESKRKISETKKNRSYSLASTFSIISLK